MSKNNKNLKEFDAAIAKWLREKRVNVELKHRKAINARFKAGRTLAIHRRSLPLLLKMMLRRSENTPVAPPQTPIAPPQLATYLIYVAFPRSNREAILGDLEEDFHDVHKKFGLRRAQFYYYVQVLRSIWPAIKNLATIVSSIKRLLIATR